MYKFLDLQKYSELVSSPYWYIKLNDEIETYFRKLPPGKNREEWFNYRTEILLFFENALREGKVSLGESSSINFDKKRKEIDTIVIHHTSTEPNTSIWMLEALGLLRLYVPEFSNPKRDYMGQPIFSGHIYEGR